MKNKTIPILLGIALLFTGAWVYTANTTPRQDCVTVYADYGVLDDTIINDCIKVGGNIDAMTVFNASGLAIQGTKKYGLQVVCRVNGFPAGGSPIGIKGHEDYIETCKDMPAEFAYWAIIVRKGSAPWNWAEVGIQDLRVKNGDSVGLVFVDNENMRFPK